ncbi:ABC transporter ATP-binding protein [Cohnella cholangitidis]|uniref:Carnitine transport ATP-binding protein OpuCA n=1 Tax=Cohnella cholangitidis TaxID=2598458 RepID=A0A7G5C0Q3_9BACL|nr:ABC transporter ATP-binding protein [Cohnella cholangitidis]QMV42787.1 ABC transporter ATP-binding protein [Cohnella cholangitidis]
MNASYLELHGIRKTFGASTVLNDVDLTIQEGELVTLLGPSGCGKSTLLRCIAGLTEPDGGRIVLGQKDIANLPPRSREVGMVFQSYALFPNLSVFENMEYGLKMRGVAKKDRARRCEELLALVDLEDKRDAYPQHLSGGQQQRVALARSLAVQPKVLLLDEPLSALDAKIRKNLRMEIRAIQQRLKMTTIFVTHDQEEALTLSDRICIMNEGRIVQDGTPEALYSTPRTEFVARFMGSYNVLTGAEAARLFGQGVGSSESYALRPESVKLLPLHAEANEGVQADKRIVQGTIESVSVLGNIIRYFVQSEGVRLTIDILNDGRSKRSEDGGTVRLALDPSQLLQLEKEGA